MEEEKAAAYYDELSRKGGGAARFKQGLGFSGASSSNDAVPSRGSAIPSTSSFLSSFVRASSPSKNEEPDRKSQLQSIQNKLKKKPREEEKSVHSSRVSKDRNDDYRSCRRSRDILSRENKSRSRERHSKHRSRSRSRDRFRDRYSRRRSRSRSSERRYRSRSTSSDRGRHGKSNRRRRSRSSSDGGRDKMKKNKSLSSPDQRLEKIRNGKGRNSGVDYATVIEGYDSMTPAERVKAKMKLQLSETAEKDEAKGMGPGWERFDINKNATLDDEEIEAAEDDAVLVKQIGQTFRFSAMEARREEKIKAAHDEAIFGTSCHPPQNKTYLPSSSPLPFIVADDEMETKNVKTSSPQSDNPLTNLISDQVMAMQQVSWRDRIRKS